VIYTVVLESSEGRELARFDSSDERLVDACDSVNAPLELACRGGDCGTCLVSVEEGDRLMAPALPDELETLRGVSAPSGARLGCQLRIHGDGLIRLRVLGRASLRPSD
jgi:ferredoxin